MSTLEKGICRLSIVPVRSGPTEQNEMVTQLLFGDHYTVHAVSENNKWIKVSAAFDGYTGWISKTQHTTISNDYFEQINYLDFKVCLDLVSHILYKKEYIYITIGSILPISSNELFKMEERLAFNGESKNLSQKSGFEFLKKISLRYINAPYLWGGKSPFGIDCSGFMQQIFKICGYKLPRDASQQVEAGREVLSLSEARPGDLAFFKNEKDNISHVGLLLENDEIIHASGKVRIDAINGKGVYNKDLHSYTYGLPQLRRILPD